MHSVLWAKPAETTIPSMQCEGAEGGAEGERSLVGSSRLVVEVNFTPNASCFGTQKVFKELER